jgi:hypothetical protein
MGAKRKKKKIFIQSGKRSSYVNPKLSLESSPTVGGNGLIKC